MDLKVVTYKDESNNIHISYFEEIIDKVFQERSNIDASFTKLLGFLQLVCFTYGIFVSNDKSKSTKNIQAVFQGALSILSLLSPNT